MRKDGYSLEKQGFVNIGKQYWNLNIEILYEHVIQRSEGVLLKGGGLCVRSGEHTARAAKDKYIVEEETTKNDIWWGKDNIPYSEEKYFALKRRLIDYFQNKEVFVQDCYAGADEENELPVRIVTEKAWHSVFVRNMLLTKNGEAHKNEPEFTVICAMDFNAIPEIDGTRSKTFIIVNFKDKTAIIGGTGYAGEIKKTIFSVMNYLLPKSGVLPMHCSANMKDDNVALFFGLSGTGKTTLSADISRNLIGDDEHGWGKNGVFNFENGCYAKIIRLSEEAEPQIYKAIHSYGAILENVIYDQETREMLLDEKDITENTRGSYPLENISNAHLLKKAGNPQNIILLTCDANGVMPPVAKLSTEQALFHFITGYTSKVGGTEVGLGAEPIATFSACFGAPFMTHHPTKYASLLRKRIEENDTDCWLINTGWIGGAFGIGKRISIKYTRIILSAILNGTLKDQEFSEDKVFKFLVPKNLLGIPKEILTPHLTWKNEDEYWKKYMLLGKQFIEIFEQFKEKSDIRIDDVLPTIK